MLKLRHRSEEQRSLCLIVLPLLSLVLSCSSSIYALELQSEILETGDCSTIAKLGDVVVVHYTGFLTDGTVIDSTVLHNAEPLPVKLGASNLIEGFEAALKGMCVGESKRVVIPPELAYGQQGVDGIVPPQSTLTFELQVVQIIEPPSQFMPWLKTIAPVLVVVGVALYFLRAIRTQENQKSVRASSSRKKSKKHK